MKIKRNSRTRMPRVCFVAPNALNLLDSKLNIKHIGGAEVQQVIVARWLADNGFDVSFITLDHGQPDNLKCGKIRVFKSYKYADGLPIIRFLFPRWSGMTRAMKTVNADIYYQRGAGTETGQVALWCRVRKKKFIFSLASDGDCERPALSFSSFRERILYSIGLSLADKILAQTANQQKSLRKNYRCESVIIRSSGSSAIADRRNNATKKNVLWIGRWSSEKRPEWILELAKRCSWLNFQVIGASNFSDHQNKKINSYSEICDNLEIHGHVPHEEMANYYEEALVVCNTSVFEGFPNVFIEAWSLGIPVVSSVDPDSVITKSGAGWLCQTIDDFENVLRDVSSDNEKWVQASIASAELYLCNHDPNKNLRLLSQVLMDQFNGAK